MLKRAKSTVAHLVRWADGANQNSLILFAGLTEQTKSHLSFRLGRQSQSKAVHFIDQVDKANLTSFHPRVSPAVYKINRSVNLADGPILSELIDILFAVISH